MTSSIAPNSIPRYRLTRTGMTRTEMIQDATRCATGCDDLPEGVTLVELTDRAWDGFEELGEMICFVLSDDEDYLADTLPDNLLPTGANYVMHRGLYAVVGENPDYRAPTWTVDSYLTAVLGPDYERETSASTRAGLDEWLGTCEVAALGDGYRDVPAEIRSAALDRLVEESA